MSFVPESSPHDQAEHPVHSDDELAHAYEKVRSASEQLSLANQGFSRMERAPVYRKERRDRVGLRGFIGLVLAGVVCTATALASQSSVGDSMREMIAVVPPQAAEARVAAPVVAQNQAADPSYPTLSEPSPAVKDQFAKVSGDVANLERAIEELRSNQEQMKAAADQLSEANARMADQIKTDQEQIAHLMARFPEKPPAPAAARPRSAAASRAVAARPAGAAPAARPHPVQRPQQPGAAAAAAPR
ncbi:MAG: hypothetical protein FWD68_04605 [Alphaproteobacteria bacterium]|nr:hypothetical protein [Alphaproteobacteria bacterium]